MKFAELSGPQLVKAYNELAVKFGLKTVKRFANHAAGVKRCDDLAKKEVGLLGQFGARPGSIREKVLVVLTENIDKQLSTTAISQAAYGVAKKKSLWMVLSGVRVMIKKHKIKAELRYEKEGNTYGLHRTQ